MLFIYYIVFLALFTVILRPFTTLIHELGHGIPALWFTDKKVTLYLGSYGNPKESFKLVFGRLEIYFNKKAFNWNIGLCIIEQRTLPINKQILISLMGPIASLMLSLVLTYTIFFVDLNNHVLVILAFFNISTYYDFYINIVPSNKPIKLHNGNIVYNDGKQIVDLIKFKKLPEEYNIGAEQYNNKDYSLAASTLETVLQKGYKEPFIYQLLVSSYLQIKDYDNALIVNNVYRSTYSKTFNSNDYTNMGLLKSFTGKYHDAIKDYNKAIELNADNGVAYNNRGYTYNLIEEYEKALIDFEKALTLEDNFAYALNNRGFAKLKLGYKEEGLADLKQSMKLDDTNAYCYMNYGIYHYDTKSFKKALVYFKKAKALDATTYLIDEFLEKTKEKLHN